MMRPNQTRAGQDMEHLDFKIVVEPKDSQSFTVILVASSRQEKSAWTSDISQCIDNIRCNGLMMNAFEDNSKVLQIRYASVERLLERLTDLLCSPSTSTNNLPASYRVFTTADVVLDKLITSTEAHQCHPCKVPGLLLKWLCKHVLNHVTIQQDHLDINKLYVSSPVSSKIPDEGEDKKDKVEDTTVSKQDLSVREEVMTGTQKPLPPSSTYHPPKNIKGKNSEFSLFSYNNGMVMSSCREMDNNRSALSAASAFAIATAGANEGTPTKEKYRRMSLASTGFPTDQRNGDKEFVIRRAATNRVLNVLRHWVSKHSPDFDNNNELRLKLLCSWRKKAAANIIRTLTQEDHGDNQITLKDVTQLIGEGKVEAIESHSALEIAEQLTLLDHLVFKVIPYEEFFGQGWMKNDKNEKTPYIMRTTKHFNDISNLIATEILRCDDVVTRVVVLEKWVAVADICRCLHNYNAVLEITSSLNRSSVFRLKKTWLKVSKQTKALIDKLQKLVSSEGRFKNLREALKNCDPPCVPYLGMYLTDLAFIEEGTPNYTEDNLVNFSKMRMISHIIREIRQFQQTAYKIDLQPKVAQYLLDNSFVLDEESMYEASLRIEPKVPN
ncbi:hypothetical protein KUCAC02_021680 [Chaenocephalus aceratus]|uniref:Uncharacterized protein n=1 Tax=Chaenocephalus aceratus TaxID=36190 RepID=A0ACB9XGU2_CHAAC|nr:hypothetical protein KUCAC02_021680 [Chaenocephalus aceratus]